MRRFIAWTMTLAAGASSVSIALGQTPKNTPRQRPVAQAPAPRSVIPGPRATAAPLDPAAQKVKDAADLRARNDMNLLLAEWERSSAKVKSLQVVFEQIDKSLKWGDKVSQGIALLRSPDLACLEFKRAIPGPDGKPRVKLNASGEPHIEVEKEPYQRIVCTGKEVLQYEWDEKAVYIYPLDKEARQKALQQGPLPFLFNMKAAEAKERYTMTLVPNDQNPTEYCIKVVPNQEIDKKDFKWAIVYLNKEKFQPSRLTLVPVGDKELQEFRFTLISPNKVIDDGYFTYKPIPNWKVERNPAPAATTAAPPGGGPGAGTPKRVAAQGADRGSNRP